MNARQVFCQPSAWRLQETSGTLQLWECTALQEVTLKDCPELEKITGLGYSLTRLHVSGLPGLPDLSQCCSLHELEVNAVSAATSLECPCSVTRLVVNGLEVLQQPQPQ
jgi:hypothetical protein